MKEFARAIHFIDIIDNDVFCVPSSFFVFIQLQMKTSEHRAEYQSQREQTAKAAEMVPAAPHGKDDANNVNDDVNAHAPVKTQIVYPNTFMQLACCQTLRAIQSKFRLCVCMCV